MLITSRHNPKIERWKKLQAKSSFRRIEKSILLEGKNLISDLIKRDPGQVQHLIIREGTASNISGHFEVTYLSKALFRELSSVEESDGIMLEYAIPDYGSLSQLLISKEKRSNLLILDRLQDPGNIGTLIRTALAFNIDAVLAIQPMCDLWNQKVLRSGKGAHFYAPLFETSWEEIVTYVHSGLFPALIGAFPPGDGVQDVLGYIKKRSDRACGWALTLGNEAQGVFAPDILPIKKVTIPMSSSVESLNVAQAGSILLYLLSQRMNLFP